MGLKQWLLKRELQKAGKQFAEADMSGIAGKVRDWVMRNKGPIGAAFCSVWGWAEVTGCPPVYDIDILGLLGLTCATATKLLGAVGFFLVGGGFLTKDDMEKRKQILQGKLEGPLPLTRVSDSDPKPMSDPDIIVDPKP